MGVAEPPEILSGPGELGVLEEPPEHADLQGRASMDRDASLKGSPGFPEIRWLPRWRSGSQP
jgi:hypothetical protein